MACSSPYHYDTRALGGKARDCRSSRRSDWLVAAPGSHEFGYTIRNSTARNPYSSEVLIMLARCLGAVLLVGALGAMARSDDRPIDRGEIDKRVVWAVYETTLLGTEIYNKGKHDECFRLYQGVLTGIHPLLDHRPRLKDFVKERLERSRNAKAVEAAFLLREALDEIQNEIAPPSGSDAKVDPKPAPKVAPKKTLLWEQLGGEKNVRAIVKDLLKAAEADKAVNFSRDGKYKLDEKARMRLEQLFVEVISAFAGGPLEYSEKRNPWKAHAGMKITEAEFDAFLGVARKTLEAHKVGKVETEELLKHLAATRVVIVEPKEKGM
jgi:hemoglobin